MLGFVLDNVSFRGRACRLDYWLLALVGPVVLAVLAFGTMMLLGRLGLILAGIALLLYLVVSLGLHVRRLHDREMSGHWLWLFWGAPAILRAVGAGAHKPALTTFCSVVAGLIGLWCLVELGIFRGTEGPNAYGDDPARG
jgi:uncharacterized membrane protein YhaH (DUF805 family)